MLNKTLFDEIVNALSARHEVKTTVIEEGYEAEEETIKFQWADVIVFQTPVNWYSVPWIFKKYIDEVYQYGVFYQSSPEYGHGGLMGDKKYMFSLTWGTAASEFHKPGGFLDNKSPDDIYIAMHKLHEYMGMQKIETFCALGVINPDIEAYKKELHLHLNKYLP